MKVGDTVKYTPVMMKDDDKPAKGVIHMYAPAGDIFKMDMLCINTVEHWIPAHECKLIQPIAKKG